MKSFNEWLDQEINKQEYKTQIYDKKKPVSKRILQKNQKILAEKDQQDQFQDNIYDFIQQNSDNEISKSNIQLYQILITIKDIFEQELDQAINNFIQKLGNQMIYRKKEINQCNFASFLQYLQIYYYQDLISCLTQLNFEECKSKKLEEFTFLFKQNIILNLLQCLKEKQIDLRQFIISNKNILKKKVINKIIKYITCKKFGNKFFVFKSKSQLEIYPILQKQQNIDQGNHSENLSGQNNTGKTIQFHRIMQHILTIFHIINFSLMINKNKIQNWFLQKSFLNFLSIYQIIKAFN